jgi:hypothetical protein
MLFYFHIFKCTKKRVFIYNVAKRCQQNPPLATRKRKAQAPTALISAISAAIYSCIHVGLSSVPIAIHLSHLTEPIAEPRSKRVSEIWFCLHLGFIYIYLHLVERTTNNFQVIAYSLPDDKFGFWFDIVLKRSQRLRTKFRLMSNALFAYTGTF